MRSTISFKGSAERERVRVMKARDARLRESEKSTSHGANIPTEAKPAPTPSQSSGCAHEDTHAHGERVGLAPQAGPAEAGSDPRGHLGVTWGVYLCAGKPPLADIILSHPPDLTRCDSVIGLAIPAKSGHIQYRGAAS